MIETTEGVNDKGERYFLAPSLVAFRGSIDVEFPYRDRASDGWIGDAAHASRVSDHNPDWSVTGYMHGIVRAIDVDIDDGDPSRDLREEILNSAIGHPAVWYVISNGKIYSRTYGWKANDYTGTNGHFHHVHISINHDLGSARNTTLLLKELPRKTNMSLTQDDQAFIEAIAKKYAIANNKYLAQMVDDIGKYAAAATDAIQKDDFAAVNGHLSAIQATVDKLAADAEKLPEAPSA